MTLATQVFSVGNDPVELTVEYQDYEKSLTIFIQNTSTSNKIFLGGPTVSYDGSNPQNYGIVLNAGDTISLDLIPGELLYAASDSLVGSIAVNTLALMRS